MSFIDLVKSRYSCRKFLAQAVEREKLQMVLESGHLAPTALNHQPVKIFVIQSEEALAKLRGVTRMAYNAPAVLMVCYDREQCYRARNYNDDHECGDLDASIVATTMMMQATELGLATLFARGFNAVEIARTFELPENWKVSCLLDLGYADPNEGGPSPRHSVRKSMPEFAEEL